MIEMGAFGIEKKERLNIYFIKKYNLFLEMIIN